MVDMNQKSYDFYKNVLGIGPEILKIAKYAEKNIENVITQIDSTKEYNQLKVINALQENNLSDTHFHGTTGYGYDDRGRDVLDSVFAKVFGSEDALVRHNFVSGTHALYVALSGNLRPGDQLLAVTGKPYDTLDEVIGIRGDAYLSLKNCGVEYKQVDLDVVGNFDYNGIKEAISPKTKMIMIQRSKGYSIRPTLTIAEIGKLIHFIKNINSEIIIMVDNCYGEFVEDREPTEVGADIIVGSLIKNPGGGIAQTGGYIAGKNKFVKRAAERLTSPGLGKKVGASLGFNRQFFQGLFFAPHVVAESLKGAVFCAAIMKKLGYKVFPEVDAFRSDIIQAIEFGDERALILFCQGIQKGSPVDSFVRPEPWEMPGYDAKVIMAAGAFTQGSSIELSADAPIKPPYVAYLQGGLVFESVKIGVLKATQMMVTEGIVNI